MLARGVRGVKRAPIPRTGTSAAAPATGRAQNDNAVTSPGPPPALSCRHALSTVWRPCRMVATPLRGVPAAVGCLDGARTERDAGASRRSARHWGERRKDRTVPQRRAATRRRHDSRSDGGADEQSTAGGARPTADTERSRGETTSRTRRLARVRPAADGMTVRHTDFGRRWPGDNRQKRL
jgi:hypothetical protein